MSAQLSEHSTMSSTARFEPSVSVAPRRGSDAAAYDEVGRRRHGRQSSFSEFDFLRRTERAIDDMGMRFRAFRKATELDHLGALFANEARLAGAKTREIARHVGERMWYLVSHSALPAWMKDNEFIHFGYRPPLNSVRSCFQSVFRLHTETGNIWTHLVGCIAFLVIGLYYLTQESLILVRAEGFSWQDRLVFGAFFGSAVICLLFSTLFHTLCCHSESVSYLFSKLDYCGIALLIMGSAVPWIYYAFYCEWFSMFNYLAGLLLLGTVCIIVTLWDRFGDAKYRTMRASLFIAFGLCGAIPAGHVYMERGLSAAFTHGGDKLLLMAALYIIGAVIYALRVPERFLPGRFDLFCHSHQIFHVFVVIAAFVTLNGLHQAAQHALEPARCIAPPVEQ